MRPTRRTTPFAVVAGACAFVSIVGCGPGTRRTADSAPPSPAPICASRIAGQEQLTSPIVVLGETHGTNEIPAAFAQLVCQSAAERRGAPILVGLEIDSSAQSAIDSYLDGDGGAAAKRALLEQKFWQREYQDGRSSQAQLALLDALRRQRTAGLRLVVKAIDVADASAMPERDARMAAAIVEAVDAIHPAQTLVLVGDVHSRVLPGYPWDAAADYVPFGAHLRTKYGNVVGLHVVSRGGSAWTCQSAVAAECGARPWRVREVAEPTPRVELDAAAVDKVGWTGTLFLAEISASAPARLQASDGTSATRNRPLP